MGRGLNTEEYFLIIHPLKDCQMVVLEVHQMAFLEVHWFLGFSPGLRSRQMHMGHKYPVMLGGLVKSAMV